MPADAARVRAAIEEALKGNKALTEREVKAAVAKTLRIPPGNVGASTIRDVRKALGIDRPSALDHARTLLANEPAAEARRVIEEVNERFGIRLGAPDVSLLLYPVYFCLVNAAIAMLIHQRRRALA